MKWAWSGLARPGVVTGNLSRKEQSSYTSGPRPWELWPEEHSFKGTDTHSPGLVLAVLLWCIIMTSLLSSPVSAVQLSDDSESKTSSCPDRRDSWPTFYL